MLGDLLVAGQGPQLSQAEVGRVARPARGPGAASRRSARRTEPCTHRSRGTARCARNTGRCLSRCTRRAWVDVLEQALERPDDGLAGALHEAGVADRERGGRHPGDDDDGHRHGEQPEPVPAVVGAPGVDVVEVDQQPGGEHQRHVDDDENHEVDQHQEVNRAGDLDAEDLAEPLEAGGQGGGHAQPGDQRQRGGDEHGDEVGDQLQAVVGHPGVLDRPVQRQVLDQHRQGVGEHAPAGGTRRCHWEVANSKT